MAYVKGQDLEKLIAEKFQGIDNWPATFYIGIGHGPLPAKSNTLAEVIVNELSGTGYARLSLARNTTDFPALALVSGDWKVSSKLLAWAASATWSGNCDWIFLTDVVSGSAGKFYGAVSIDNPVLLQAGDTFSDTFEYQDR